VRPFGLEWRRLYPIVCVKGKGSCVADSPNSPEARERLAAALRENLKRRKAKTRDQAARTPAAEVSPGQDVSEATPRSGEKQGG
jgi:hypothetical protein